MNTQKFIRQIGGPVHAILATDIVIFQLQTNRLHTLLVKPKANKFPGKFAFPGGLVSPNESLEGAAQRFFHSVIRTTGKPHLEQLATFGDPKRDPSGRVVSVAYFALVSPQAQINSHQTEFPEINWLPLSRLPSLAYDHPLVAKEALNRLRSKLSYTNLVSFLLPQEFTLTQLQSAYETILGRPLDKRNFRKKVKSLNLLKQLPRLSKGLSHRPAALYSFISTKPEIIPIL